MIDYMIMEAVLIKVKKEDEKLRKDAELESARSQWRKSGQDLAKEINSQQS